MVFVLFVDFIEAARESNTKREKEREREINMRIVFGAEHL
jgi:hypothetical protein